MYGSLALSVRRLFMIRLVHPIRQSIRWLLARPDVMEMGPEMVAALLSATGGRVFRRPYATPPYQG